MSIVVGGGVVQRPRGTRAVFTGPHTAHHTATGTAHRREASGAGSTSVLEQSVGVRFSVSVRLTHADLVFLRKLRVLFTREPNVRNESHKLPPPKERKKVRRRLLRIGTVATAPSSPAKARDGRDGQGEGERVATQQLRVYTHARQLCAVWQQLLRVDPELVDLQRKATGGAVRRRERVWRSGWEEAVREEAVTEASRGGTPAGGEAGRGAAPAAAG